VLAFGKISAGSLLEGRGAGQEGRSENSHFWLW